MRRQSEFYTLLFIFRLQSPNWFETIILYLKHWKSELFHLKGSKICNTTKKILRRRESSVSNESRQQQEEEEKQLEPGKLSLLCASRARHSNFVGNQIDLEFCHNWQTKRLRHPKRKKMCSPLLLHSHCCQFFVQVANAWFSNCLTSLEII